MEKKQSSVEWLVEQFKKDLNLRLRGFNIDKALEQAKAMHKEEIMDAIIESEKEDYSNAEVYPPEFVLRKAEQYYNETFGGDNE